MQTIAVMNAGGRLDQALHAVTVPERLAGLPYLQPVYDEPEFIVRTSGGVTAAGTTATRRTSSRARGRRWPPSWPRWPGAPRRLAERALELADVRRPPPGRPPGRDRPAGRARGPGSPHAHAEVFERRAEAERSTMAKGSSTGPRTSRAEPWATPSDAEGQAAGAPGAGGMRAGRPATAARPDRLEQTRRRARVLGRRGRPARRREQRVRIRVRARPRSPCRRR